MGARDVPAGETVPLTHATVDEVSDLLDSRVLPQLGEVPKLQYRGRRSVSPGMQVSMLEAKLQFWSENLPPRSFVAIANVAPGEVAAEGGAVG